MSRRKPELQAIDVNAWPTVAHTELDEPVRRKFEARRQAILRYIAGEPIRAIEKSTHFNRRQLYRWLERAQAVHPDGRPFGFRALIHYVRIAEYARVRDVQLRGERGSRGAAGALAQLLERSPTLTGWLLLQLKQRKVWLEQVHTDGHLRTRLRGLQSLHDNFLRQCRSVGLTAADYPLNTADHAIRSLSRRVKAEMLGSFGSAARSAGAKHLKGLPRVDDSGPPAAVRPYQVVEFDGHRLDVRLKVVVRDPLGFTHEFEMERVWLLVIIDVCTRAVIGYHIALAREYSRYDVIKTIENALTPHRPRTFTIPGLTYGPHDGFPSGKMPELGYVTWEWIRLDNAKANLADETMTALCEFVGCLADAGPKHSPDERAISNASLARLPVDCLHVCRVTPVLTYATCAVRSRIPKAICASMSPLMNWRNSLSTPSQATTAHRTGDSTTRLHSKRWSTSHAVGRRCWSGWQSISAGRSA